jgi:tRNA pseudouridine55 synthase
VAGSGSAAVGGKPLRRRVDGIVLLDKPYGLSSNAALQAVKRLFHAAKAGHTGSLDPLATGLLPVCLGEATKLSSHLLDADKTYRARACLGIATATGDAEGPQVKFSDPSAVTAAALENAAASLVGEIRQVPPMYSALKRDGRPLYALAREGVEVERQPRTVCIHSLRLLAFGGAEFEFEVRCSKGTYVRTLAEDWAGALGQVAHLTALRRCGLGPYDEAHLVTLAQLESAAAAGDAGLFRHLRPLAEAVAGWVRLGVDGAQAAALAHGRPVTIGPAAAQRGPVAVLGPAGELLGLAEADGLGALAPRRWLLPAETGG